jgi:hypothetical protein
MKFWRPSTSASANSLQLLSSVSTSTALYRMLRLNMGSSYSVLSMHRYHSSSNLRVGIRQLIKASNLRGLGLCNKQTKSNPHKNKFLKFRTFLYSSQIHFQTF